MVNGVYMAIATAGCLAARVVCTAAVAVLGIHASRRIAFLAIDGIDVAVSTDG